MSDSYQREIAVILQFDSNGLLGTAEDLSLWCINDHLKLYDVYATDYVLAAIVYRLRKQSVHRHQKITSIRPYFFEQLFEMRR